MRLKMGVKELVARAEDQIQTITADAAQGIYQDDVVVVDIEVDRNSYRNKIYKAIISALTKRCSSLSISLIRSRVSLI